MKPTSVSTTILVRRGGDIHPYAINETVTIGKILSGYGRGCKMIHVQRDVFKRIIKSVPVDRSELAINYCRPIGELPEAGEEAPKYDDFIKDEETCDGSVSVMAAALFDDCDLWVVDNNTRTRIFFNPYTRMVLGLPMWFLDLYVTPTDRVLELDMLLRYCLHLKPDENRFALYGNYRSHCSKLVDSAHALELVRGEDPENIKFYQYMMLPEHETQAHLGVTRQSPLVIHDTGLMVGSRRYWFALQGTSLFYFKSPTDRSWSKAIAGIDECQVIYRGGNKQKTTYTFDIIEPNGKKHSCKSHSKKRVEKWVKCLQRCHTSREINEPITMEMVESFSAPQTIPPICEIPKKVPVKAPHEENGVLDETQLPELEYDRWIAEVERMVKQIEFGSETLLTRKKPRRKEVSVWIESIRAFLQSILKIETTAYACKVVPEVQSLVTDIINFTSIVEGRSEFVPTESLNSEYIDAIMDSTNGLFAVFRNAALEEQALPEKIYDKEGRAAMIKLRRALRKPIMQAKIGKIRTKSKPAKKSDGKAKSKGLFNWFTKVTSKKNTKIPENEVKELSMTEYDNTEAPGSQHSSRAPSQNGSKAASRVDSQKSSRAPSAPQTPKTDASIAERHRATKEYRSQKKKSGDPMPKQSFWNRLGFGGHSRNLSETIMTETEMDMETVASKCKSILSEVEEAKVVSSRAGRAHSSNTSKPAQPSHLRTVVDETMAKTNEFESILDNYDPDESAQAGTSPWISASHKARDSLSHRRASSLRMPPHSSSSEHEENQRRKSVIEIDPTLLSALLKDQRLAGMISSKKLEETDSSAAASSNFVSVDCTICQLKILKPEDLKKTPFASFHEECLKCDDCGLMLSTINFRLEAGRPFCRNECSAEPLPAQGIPLKSCLKKSSKLSQ